MSDDQLRLGTRIRVNDTNRLESLHGLKGTIVATQPGGSYLAWIDEEAEVFDFNRGEIDVHVEPTVVRIRSRERLLELKAQLDVRDDWHEPSERLVTAEVRGKCFDNAGTWGRSDLRGKSHEEVHVVLRQDGDEVAIVNLATLFAFATGYEG
jgi:hypothetical protein